MGREKGERNEDVVEVKSMRLSLLLIAGDTERGTVGLILLWSCPTTTSTTKLLPLWTFLMKKVVCLRGTDEFLSRREMEL